MSELSNDFDLLVEQINAKLNEATKALKEANELKKKAGLETLIFTNWTREGKYSEFTRKLEEERGDDDYDIDRSVDDMIEDLSAQYHRINVSS